MCKLHVFKSSSIVLYVRTDGLVYLCVLFFGFTCQNPCGIYHCMIIGAFVTSKGTKRGLDPMTC